MWLEQRRQAMLQLHLSDIHGWSCKNDLFYMVNIIPSDQRVVGYIIVSGQFIWYHNILLRNVLPGTDILFSGLRRFIRQLTAAQK